MSSFSSRLPFPDGKAVIVPSILSADLCSLGRDVAAAEDCGAGWLQIDVMDGHFVPNISFGPAVVKSLRKSSGLALDAHLMIDNPEDFIEPFAKAGADLITVHYEALKGRPEPVLEKIRGLGLKAGLAVKPETDIHSALRLLKYTDLFLVMTVNPGFGGQAFLPQSPERIKTARAAIKSSGLPVWLQVDGGICAETVKTAVESGADSLVAGSAVFGHGGIPASMKDLLKLIKEAVIWQ